MHECMSSSWVDVSTSDILVVVGMGNRRSCRSIRTAELGKFRKGCSRGRRGLGTSSWVQRMASWSTFSTSLAERSAARARTTLVVMSVKFRGSLAARRELRQRLMFLLVECLALWRSLRSTASCGSGFAVSVVGVSIVRLRRVLVAVVWEGQGVAGRWPSREGEASYVNV